MAYAFKSMTHLTKTLSGITISVGKQTISC